MQNPDTRYTTADTLARVLDTSLRLLHPFTPFVTEELWGHLRETILESPISALAEDWSDVLITAKWPEERDPEGWEDKVLEDFSKEQEIIRAIRNARAEKNIKPSVRFIPTLVTKDDYDLFTTDSGVIASLSGTHLPELFTDYTVESENHMVIVSGSTDIYIPLDDLVDPIEQRTRLEKELKETESHIARLEKMLNSPFAKKAPPAVVDKEREKLAGYKETAEKIKAQL